VTWGCRHEKDLAHSGPDKQNRFGDGVEHVYFPLRQIGCCAAAAEQLNNSSVGPVAQVVEQLTFNQWVEGSNPSGLTIVLFSLSADRSFLKKCHCDSLLAASSCTQ
jgi:hypothetical protein